jgi:hypothetical protein
MILSKREKTIAYVTGTTVGLFLLNYVAVAPLMAHRDDLVTKVQHARSDLSNAQHTVSHGKVMNKRWSQMTQAGLTADTSTAEAQAQNALNAFADDSRLLLTSNKPERTEHVKLFNQIIIRSTATGSLSSIGRFLYRIQTSEIPMKVTDFQITSRKEGTDDLTLSLGVSTIALAPPEKPKPGARPAAGGSSASAAQTGGAR